MHTIDKPIVGSILMCCVVFGMDILLTAQVGIESIIFILMLKITSGAIAYLFFLYFFDKKAFRILKRLRNART